MKKLLRKLYRRKNQNVKLILVDDDSQENPEMHVFRPINVMVSIVGIILTMLMVLFIILYFSGLGSVMFGYTDTETRQAVEEITGRVIALQDSLEVRDQQLRDMQNAVTGQSDTVFASRDIDIAEFMEGAGRSGGQRGFFPPAGIDSRLELEANQIINSTLLSSTPSFPTSLPVDGSISRDYKPDARHFGIDIAAQQGTPITNIADGMVISSNRSIQNGNTIAIQHAEGYVSIYKHCHSLVKEAGDYVKKGDVIATVGSTGMYSSGPHLHLELWKDGVSLDPEVYFHDIN